MPNFLFKHAHDLPRSHLEPLQCKSTTKAVAWALEVLNRNFVLIHVGSANALLL